MSFKSFKVPYEISEQYNKKVAYFSMEFAIHQPLKIYSGGLGFLAGSHLRSAYELRQNLIGIGMLWKYGYYDQARNQDQTLEVTFMEKIYSFLEDTGIRYQILIHEHPVWVKAFYLPPTVFNSAPLFLLSTDLPENDYVSQTITHRLYDANVATKVAQFILLGVGGAKLIDELGFQPDVYHLNEAHGISSAFYLLNKWKSIDKVREKLVFTTHTPEEAGAQNWRYWADKQLYRAMEEGNDAVFDDRKKYLKKRAFEIVADQTGKVMDPNVLTIVWARRFAGYKRADMLTYNMEWFEALVSNSKYPVQIIWAGKPYPADYPAISEFNKLVHLSKNYKNVSVLVGYELGLSKRLKQAADIWLNNPRVPREASGTSGMTAAMNGAINFSTDDGWIPEFINHGNNGFVVPKADYQNMKVHDQDDYDLKQVYDILNQQILPMYYENFDTWRQIQKNGMRDVRFQFDSNRMAHEYYEIMYKES